jgi:branched-chain amino acid aminotransferase
MEGTRPMQVLLNGAFVAEDAARVSLFDRGFLYGDGAFETLAAYGGRIFRAAQHVQRLAQSLRALRIDPPRTGDDMQADLYALLERNGMRDAILRISVSRGPGPRGASMHGAGAPSYAIACYPPKLPAQPLRRHGAKLALVSVRKTPAQSKSANYLNSILALAEATDQGADEALLLDMRGMIAECAYSNVFVVTRDGLVTPALETGIFPGITRSVILEVARAQAIAAKEVLVDPSLLLDADEVFITNTVSGVLPVRAVGEHSFAAPGPVTSRLAQGYWSVVEQEAGRPWSAMHGGGE